MFAKNHVRKCFLIFSLIVFRIFNLSEAVPQQKYGFDFAREWIWEDLISRAANEDPGLISSVNILRNEISIIDGRILFRLISDLDSLNEVSGLRNYFPDEKSGSKIGNLVGLKNDSDSFGKLIRIAIAAAGLRRHCDGPEFNFVSKFYLPQPEKFDAHNIDITFDYEGAEKIIEYFDNTGINETHILATEPYAIITSRELDLGISKKSLAEMIDSASSHDKLNSLYKWINPKSYMSFGGVYSYSGNFRNVINTLKENESNIALDIKNRLSNYLPESSYVKAKVSYLFYDSGPSWNYRNNFTGINMQFFCDNYEHLIKTLKHEIYINVLSGIQIPLEIFITKENDRVLAEIISRSVINGVANYVSAIGSETRPWHLLEKDFKLFNRTFREIYFSKNSYLIDSLISTGFAAEAPFYTMATQMAYIIESTHGKKALIESLRSGPVAFFNEYIESYMDYPEKIRPVFRFTSQVEKKIKALNSEINQNEFKQALRLYSLNKDSAEFRMLVNKFASDTKPGNMDAFNLLCGFLYLKAGEYSRAKNYFMNGIRSGDSLLGYAGDLFCDKGAYNYAKDFYEMYVEHFPASSNAYAARGKYFFQIGELENSKKDFEKGMLLNPSCKICVEYIKRMQ